VAWLGKLWPWLAAALSGFLYAACFAPLEQSWLCWFALAPLIAAAWFANGNIRRRWRQHLLLGYVAGVVFFTATFGWLGSLGVLFENVWLRGLPLLLSTYLALNIAFWTWCVGLFRPTTFVSSWRNLLCATLCGCAWVTHEWIRGWLFTGFGWNGLGVALYRNWPLIQVAQFTGVCGLSFLVAATNVIAVTTALRLFQEARSHRMRPHWDLNLTILAIVALFVFGWRSTQAQRPVQPLRVAAVQANVAQQEKFDPSFSAEILATFRDLSTTALRADPPPALLVWPESATPDPVRDNTTASARFVRDFAASANADLLLGTIDLNDDQVFNAALLVSDRGRHVEVYHKLHLVPFGEYVPLRKAFPLFAAIAGRWVTGDFDIGKDYTVFALTNPAMRVAPLICFEDTLGDLTRQFVRRGANILVNMTNDGWFLHSAGSKQHLANAVFRCAETQCPMIRAANTGVTAVINPHGRVTQVLQDRNGSTFTRDVLMGEVNVPQDGRLTFYVGHGELFAQICAGVTMLSLALYLFIVPRFGRVARIKD
jgi:apolipoprotein N-acyltransferase